MAIVLDGDDRGRFAEVRCDRYYCPNVLGMRPGIRDSAYDVVRDLFDLAQELGWRLAGRAWCPEHAYDRPGRRTTVGDGFAWADVRAEPVKGAKRRSEPFTGGPTH